jgi:AcrR family transcriptional regulator
VTEAPTRRERLRTATLADIKRAARDLVVHGGPAAVSLRAIARTLGMSAAALYRYYPSLQDLVCELCADLFGELTALVQAAAEPDTEPALRLTAMGQAFRHWCVTHPAEFALMFGNPVPGVRRDHEVLSPEHPGTRFGAVFVEPFAELWLASPAATRPGPDLGDWGGPMRALYGDRLPEGALYMFLTAWTRMYGLIAMEVFGHLHWAVTDVEPLFEAEMAAFLRELG